MTRTKNPDTYLKERLKIMIEDIDWYRMIHSKASKTIPNRTHRTIRNAIALSRLTTAEFEDLCHRIERHMKEMLDEVSEARKAREAGEEPKWLEIRPKESAKVRGILKRLKERDKR